MVDESSCTITYTYNIQIIRTPVVNFTYSADLLEVSFTDLSENEPDSWLWYFGDGTTSAEQDPVHTMQQPVHMLFVCRQATQQDQHSAVH